MNTCCLILENLRIDHQSPVPNPEHEVKTCIVCGRKHYTLNVEPGHFGVK